MDSGLEVQVNPVSAAGGTLLYPGGQYLRVVPVPAPAGRYRRPHRPAPAPQGCPHGQHRRAAPGGAPLCRNTPSGQAVPPGQGAAGRRSSKTRAGAEKSGERAPGRNQPPRREPLAAGQRALARPVQLPSLSPGSAPATQLASAAPTPGGTEGLAKQGVILFSHEADAPADTAIDAIRLLAAQLNNVMTRPQSRIELMAFGGNKGDKGSDARRLSLKRALSIRQVLIDSGVSSTRIDVHAEGGVDDTGPADRVDVYVKAQHGLIFYWPHGDGSFACPMLRPADRVTVKAFRIIQIPNRNTAAFARRCRPLGSGHEIIIASFWHCCRCWRPVMPPPTPPKPPVPPSLSPCL